MRLLASLSALVLFGLSAVASAQATRTWVSGVGDDANPGSRTAPCKTFAGVIDKTANKGIINILDPGSYGSVTITKSLTIDGGGTEGNVLASATTGIIINAGNTDVVVLRNLNLDGLDNNSPAGIRIINAGAVYLENCNIKGFVVGVDDQSATTTGTQIFLKGCQIRECSAEGLKMSPAEGAASVAMLEQTRIQNCGTGILVNARGRAMLSECSIAFNVADGLRRTTGGVIQSFKNNRIVGNSPDGKPTPLSNR
jgi:hypothetical protein